MVFIWFAPLVDYTFFVVPGILIPFDLFIEKLGPNQFKSYRYRYASATPAVRFESKVFFFFRNSTAFGGETLG